MLRVRRETLERHGAVSEETAKEMAAGARRVCAADVAVSVTESPAPTRDPQTPVGTVYVGFAADGVSVARRYQLWGTRDWIRLLASQMRYLRISNVPRPAAERVAAPNQGDLRGEQTDPVSRSPELIAPGHRYAVRGEAT